MTDATPADVRTPNTELAYRVLDHIDAHPELWRQSSWLDESECGTTACFAGWAVLLSGCKVSEDEYCDNVVHEGPAEVVGMSIPRAADTLLGIDPDTLPVDPYDGLNTREELGSAVIQVFGPRPTPQP